MSRQAFTARLIDLVPEDYKMSIEQATLTWWVNSRNNGGFRLTHNGYEIMSDVLNIENWTIKAPPNLKLLLELDKKLQTPYYVNAKKKEIVLFGSRDAMMVALHGDLKRYIELLDRRSNGSTT